MPDPVIGVRPRTVQIARANSRLGTWADHEVVEIAG